MRTCSTTVVGYKMIIDTSAIIAILRDEPEVMSCARQETTVTKKEFAPVMPSKMLKEEFLVEYGLSQNQLAKAIGISPNRLPRSSTIVDALRQTLRSGSVFYFGNSAEFWVNPQSHYDLKMARNELKPGDIKRINLAK